MPVFSSSVTPYRKSGKNGGNDAEAICEAVRRPTMRFVPIKTADQQAVLTLHRVRQGFIAERPAVIDRLRGLLSEFGLTVLQGAVRVRHGLHSLTEQLPGLAARARTIWVPTCGSSMNGLPSTIASSSGSRRRMPTPAACRRSPASGQ
jgi:transposase